MKRIMIAALCCGTMMLSGCGESSSYVGETAIISLPDGTVVTGEIESMTKWSSTCVEVVVDDVAYSVHPLCIACIDE